MLYVHKVCSSRRKRVDNNNTLVGGIASLKGREIGRESHACSTWAI